MKLEAKVARSPVRSASCSPVLPSKMRATKRLGEVGSGRTCAATMCPAGMVNFHGRSKPALAGSSGNGLITPSSRVVAM